MRGGAAEWNPELTSKYRSIGRPRKRWEDDINEFLKQIEDEIENLTDSSNQINKNWINTAKRPRKMDATRGKLHNEFIRRHHLTQWKEDQKSRKMKERECFFMFFIFLHVSSLKNIFLHFLDFSIFFHVFPFFLCFFFVLFFQKKRYLFFSRPSRRQNPQKNRPEVPVVKGRFSFGKI